MARLFPLATVVTPNLPEAEALAGSDRLTPVPAGERLARARGAGGDRHRRPRTTEPVDHLFDGAPHVEIPVERHDVAATHGAGCTHSATLAALLARGLSLEEAARGAAQAASARSRTACRRSAQATARSTS